MKKVHYTAGLTGIALLYIAATMSDCGTFSPIKVIALGIVASLMILFSLYGVNFNSQVCEKVCKKD